MYNHTQAEFKAQGVEFLSLHRGMTVADSTAGLAVEATALLAWMRRR